MYVCCLITFRKLRDGRKPSLKPKAARSLRISLAGILINKIRVTSLTDVTANHPVVFMEAVSRNIKRLLNLGNNQSSQQEKSPITKHEVMVKGHDL